MLAAWVSLGSFKTLAVIQRVDILQTGRICTNTSKAADKSEERREVKNVICLGRGDVEIYLSYVVEMMTPGKIG